MIPLQLRITNFRSFKGLRSFTFPRCPGLYFMQGVNEVEPRLEGNAAGKSTIWDALTWCWYGKTPRGLKAGDVCHWGADKGVSVDFLFMRSSNGEPCKLTRTWKPNTWTLSTADDGVTIDLVKEKDNPALTWLALEFEPWLNSVLIAQSEPMFLDLKKEPQAALFSSVLGLDRWLDYSSKASKLVAERDREARALERELERLRGELAGLGSHDYRESAQEWDRKASRRLDDLAEDHAKLLERRKGHKHALEAAQEREEALRGKVAQASTDKRAEERLAELRAEARQLEREEAVEKSKLEALDDRRYDLKNLGASCHFCGQEITEKHLELERARCAQESAAGEKLMRRLRDLISTAEAEAGSLDTKLREAREAREELEQEATDARHAVTHARNDLQALDRRLDDLEEEAERAAHERNPYRDMQERAAEKAEHLGDQIERLKDEVDQANERVALFQMWVRGFKEVRLSLIAEALTELEIEVNSCCDALGLLGWELEFRVDRETKGGSIQRGFDCFVRSPHNERAVPWEAWSGGESQRLRLAAQMGLANLIRTRTGTPLALEVWDEPTAGLSPQGIRDLLECLTTRAHRESREIWLVDHRTFDYGGFAGGATITKTSKGSEVVQY